MNEYLLRYLSYLSHEKGCAKGTVDSYRRDLVQFIRFLEETGTDELSKVTRSQVQNYFHHLRKLGRATATLNRSMVSIRLFFKYWTGLGLLEKDPALQLESLKAAKRLPKILSVQDVAALLETPDVSQGFGLRDKAMLELLYATGIRVSELVSLNRDQVHLDLGYMRCIGKSGKERIIPVHSTALQWLRRYMAAAVADRPRRSTGETALFLSHQGNRLTRQGFWKIIKKYASDSGVSAEITPHMLRHSFAAHLLENGADLRSIQQMMGHADLSSTQLYAQAGQGRMQDVYNRSHPRATLQTMEKG